MDRKIIALVSLIAIVLLPTISFAQEAGLGNTINTILNLSPIQNMKFIMQALTVILGIFAMMFQGTRFVISSDPNDRHKIKQSLVMIGVGILIALVAPDLILGIFT
jgi:hypothetical protein